MVQEDAVPVVEMCLPYICELDVVPTYVKVAMVSVTEVGVLPVAEVTLVPVIEVDVVPVVLLARCVRYLWQGVGTGGCGTSDTNIGVVPVI